VSPFKNFTKTYGTGSNCRAAPSETVEKYAHGVPEELLQYWREVGWCAYARGLVWLMNPDDLVDVLDDWLGPDHGAIPFCRSAFGNIFVWHQGEVKSLATQSGRINTVMSRIDVFFNGVLLDERYLDGMFHKKLFRQALKKLGPLEYDECYAFEPVLALGGSGELDTVRKVKMREYLGILAQLVAKR
jgi:hypothetical protein